MIRVLLLLVYVLRSLSSVLGGVVSTNAEADRIISLPDVTTMPDFAMYSGYLDIRENKKLHYWLNMCEDESSDALIVWFNGGPGCSSMEGFFVEHGPLKFHPVTGLPVGNNYSWNKLAHTLYIESPAGVGFSYDDARDPVSDDSMAHAVVRRPIDALNILRKYASVIIWNAAFGSPAQAMGPIDAKKQVSEDTLKALLGFFTKFPQLEYCDLYISGESYAGVYIPTLVARILQSQPRMAERIQGLMIGNGLLNSKLNDQSLVYFAYYHGLFGEDLWEDLLNSCCEEARFDQCNFYQFMNMECMTQVMRVIQIVGNGGLNIYNLYHDCTPSEQLKQQKYFRDSLIKLLGEPYGKQLGSYVSLAPPCSNSTVLTRYLNRPEVQSAIHVRSMTWEICSDRIHTNYEKKHCDMTPYLKTIIKKMDARVLLYFGDVDMACNHLGGEWFTDALGFETTVPRRSWKVEKNGADQIAGYVKEFHKLTFATIKGAGHMVPTDAPQAAFHMIEKFMNYEPL